MTALNLGIQESEKSRNLGSKKIQKIQILKIQIRVAQNVSKVWISRKKQIPAPDFGHFFHGPDKLQMFCLFSLVGQWAFTRFGVIYW